MSIAGFRRFAWFVLGLTLAVILWGAYVRASGSGAGCGSHWPTCNGDVIPRAKSIQTIIEFSHRASSGVISMLVLALLVLAFRLFGKGHVVRRAASLSMVFLVSEALIGAGLVLFELVAHDASVARAVSVSAHLVNTFLLLGSLTLTVFFARENKPPELRFDRSSSPALLGGLALVVVVGMTGAVAALGDTLFPVSSLAQGLASDASRGSHLFVRIRSLHPFTAVIAAGYLLVMASLVTSRSDRLRPLAGRVSTLVVVQIVAGAMNLVLLAPVAMQLVHLLVADILFIALVRLTAASFDSASTGEPALLPQSERTA